MSIDSIRNYPGAYSVAPYSNVPNQMPTNTRPSWLPEWYPMVPTTPWQPGDPILGNLPELPDPGRIGGNVASGFGTMLSGFWQRSGNTIILWIIGSQLIALGIVVYAVRVVRPAVVVGPRARVG